MPGQLEFGEQPIGAVSQAQSITVRNDSPLNVTLEASLKQDQNQDFIIQGNDCSALSPRQSCSIKVEFRPSEATSRVAFLMMRDSSGDSPHSVRLSGIGKTPDVMHIDIHPDALTFENQPLNTPSPEQEVTITSTGNQPVQVRQVTKAGDNPQDFDVTNDGCSGKSLQPQEACSVSVRFRPSARASRKGSIEITDSSGDAPHIVMLAGTGIVPTFVHARVDW
jgi:hypothetical protein